MKDNSDTSIDDNKVYSLSCLQNQKDHELSRKNGNKKEEAFSQQT